MRIELVPQEITNHSTSAKHTHQPEPIYTSHRCIRFWGRSSPQCTQEGEEYPVATFRGSSSQGRRDMQ